MQKKPTSRRKSPPEGKSPATAKPAEESSPTTEAPKETPKANTVMGRPSSFDEEIAKEICERIAKGEPVRQISLLEHMPCEGTIYNWLMRNEDFFKNYARAKAAQADRFSEELAEIADDGTNDWIERENERTGKTYVVLNEEAISRSKLRVETRKWLMSKFKPKRYGDKVEVEHSGQIDSRVTVMTDDRLKVLMDKKRASIERLRLQSVN